MNSTGKLWKYSPAMPIINRSTTPENDPLQFECLALILERDFVGFESLVLIEGQQHWVRNSDLFQINEDGEVAGSSFDEGFYDAWDNK